MTITSLTYYPGQGQPYIRDPSTHPWTRKNTILNSLGIHNACIQTLPIYEAAGHGSRRYRKTMAIVAQIQNSTRKGKTNSFFLLSPTHKLRR
jgi:hypothetical protein